MTKFAGAEMRQILAFIRKSFLFIFNFNPIKSFVDYGFLVKSGEYEVALDTDSKKFGGNGLADDSMHHFTIFDPKYKYEKRGWLKMYLPARSAVVLKKLRLRNA